jgi:hypothetical protein
MPNTVSTAIHSHAGQLREVINNFAGEDQFNLSLDSEIAREDEILPAPEGTEFGIG